MKLKQVGIFGVLTVLAGFGLFSMLYTMYRLKDNQEFLDEESAQIEQIEKARGEEIVLTETRHGRRKWVLKMDKIRYSKDNNTADLSGVQGLVYDDAQKVLFTFRAPKGRYYKQDNRIVLSDGARMISPKAKILLTANSLDWSAKDNMVKATGGVKMAKKNFGQSKAQSALFAMDFSQIQFSGQATAVIGGHPNTGDEKTP